MPMETEGKYYIDMNGRLLEHGRPVGIIQKEASGAVSAIIDSTSQCREINRFLMPRCRSIRFQVGLGETLAQREGDTESTPSRVRVYQLRPEVEPELKFIGYQDMVERNGGIDPARYTVVYEGDVPSENPEVVYQAIRDCPPAGFSGHGLTRSDVLELFGPTKSSFYYVDTYARQPVPFEPKEQAREIQIQMEMR